MLALLASVIVLILTPGVSDAHGNHAPRPAATAERVSVVLSAQDLEPRAVRSAFLLESRDVAAPRDFAAASPGAADANCLADCGCCNAACHMMLGPMGPLLGTRDLAPGQNVLSVSSLVAASPIFGLFRPPRSI